MMVVDAVRQDLTDAMRAGERERVAALRLLLSELQKAVKDGESDEIAVLRRERKRRLEAEHAFRDAGRGELADGEAREAELIGAYLPAELSDDELAEIVRRVVEQTGASSPKDAGRTIGVAMREVAGRADGRRVSERVREVLAAS